MFHPLVPYHDVEINPVDFNANSDFFSEAWGISPDGHYVVGTAGQMLRGMLARPHPNPESGNFYGFTYRADTHELHPINYLNAVATSFIGCNDVRDVVGFCRNAQNELHGLVWLDGQLQPPFFDVAGSKPVQLSDGDEFIHNAVFGINNNRVVVGTFRDINEDRDLGFVAYANDPAAPLVIDMRAVLRTAPAIDSSKITSTIIAGINNKGDIVGSYVSDGRSFPFKWALQNDNLLTTGNVTLLNHPNADVVATAVNDHGCIVCRDNADPNNPNSPVHGFLWFPDAAGDYKVDDEHLWQIDVITQLPAGVVQRTFPNSIDSWGTVVGAYRKDAGNTDSMGKPISNRRAFVGNVPLGRSWWTNILDVPFYPPIPNPRFPFLPPFPWSVFMFGGILQQPAEVALVMLFLQVSTISDITVRHRLRALILEMLCEQNEKLQKQYNEAT